MIDDNDNDGVDDDDDDDDTIILTNLFNNNNQQYVRFKIVLKLQLHPLYTLLNVHYYKPLIHLSYKFVMLYYLQRCHQMQLKMIVYQQ